MGLIILAAFGLWFAAAIAALLAYDATMSRYTRGLEKLGWTNEKGEAVTAGELLGVLIVVAMMVVGCWIFTRTQL